MTSRRSPFRTVFSLSAVPAAAALAAGLLLAAPAMAQGLPGMGGKQPVEINADQAIEWHQDVRA